jgi:hypothetical protein
MAAAARTAEGAADRYERCERTRPCDPPPIEEDGQQDQQARGLDHRDPVAPVLPHGGSGGQREGRGGGPRREPGGGYRGQGQRVSSDPVTDVRVDRGGVVERPAPGNHEYYAYTKHGDNEPAQNGTGYFGYFNGHDQNGTPNTQGQAGDDTDASQGWYSYDLGNWHIISLNIECQSAAFNNDCSTTDGGLLAQETQWLAADLASNHKACTIAYWHQPTFTAVDTSADVADPSAPGADSAEGLAADARWKLLYHARATRLRQRRLPGLTSPTDSGAGPDRPGPAHVSTARAHERRQERRGQTSRR